MRETKAALNSTLRHVVATQLQAVVDAESVSFDEPAFRSNLARMLERSRS